MDNTDPKTRVNKDGSIYILLGPDAPPKGWEANYVQTLPGRGWFAYFRLEQAIVKSWEQVLRIRYQKEPLGGKADRLGNERRVILIANRE